MSFGDYLKQRTASTADVRDGKITGTEGRGLYLVELAQTGATVRATASPALGRLQIGSICTLAPFSASGIGNGTWQILTARTSGTALPPEPPAVVSLVAEMATSVHDFPTLLTAGGDPVTVTIYGSGLTTAPTYGSVLITDDTAQDITSTVITLSVKADAAIATGTVTTDGTVDIVGTGTNFTDFAAGQTFYIVGETDPRTIDTITDDTHLAVTLAATTTASDVGYAVGFSLTVAGVTLTDFFHVTADVITAAFTVTPMPMTVTSGGTVSGTLTADSISFPTSEPGTIAVVSGSADVVGTGTAFTNYRVGQSVQMPALPGASTTAFCSFHVIVDDTHATLFFYGGYGGVAPTTASGLAWQVGPRYSGADWDVYDNNWPTVFTASEIDITIEVDTPGTYDITIDGHTITGAIVCT